MQHKPLVDPDCKDGKHATCAGGPCACGCHLPLELHARLAVVAAAVIARHKPDVFSAREQGLTCAWCSKLACRPVAWPCLDRAAVGHLMPDPSNRLLPFDEHGRDLPDASPADPSG